MGAIGLPFLISYKRFYVKYNYKVLILIENNTVRHNLSLYAIECIDHKKDNI